jgi:hypothetical protein
MTTSIDQTVLSASSFVGSIGVNTHAGFSWGAYNNVSLMVDDLKYLGVTHLRDAMPTSPGAQPVVEGLAAAGYKFDFIVSSALPASGSTGLQQYIVTLDKFLASHPGSISAIEGLNEANIQLFTYHGSSSLAAAAQFQSDLYHAVKADASLAGIAVYNLSLGYNDPAGYAQLGNMSGSSDYANAHAYVSTGSIPQSSIAATLSAVGSADPGRPFVITETGYTTQANTPYLGVDQNVQAKSILNTLVDAYKAGVSSTYLYELLDRNSSSSDTNPEDHFGLFNSDGTPKLAAKAIHNLTTILNDDGKGGHQPTAALNYSLGNMPVSGNSMVLGKSNGTYELVIWAEPKVWDAATSTEVFNSAQPVSINLGGVHHSVNVYDPMGGTTPIATYTDVSSITVPISDHPLIIEIDAPAGPGQTVNGPASVSGTAAGIVAQLTDLNASSTLQTITLTDTHTLPVASESTMTYIVSHYAKALAAIQGGYSFSVTTSAAAWSKTVTYDASGNLLSTSNTGMSNGLPISTTVVYTDGSKDGIAYSAGVKTSQIHVAKDNTKTTDWFDAKGNITTEVVQKVDGYYSTTLYSNGIKTKAFILNADHTQDNYSYNITGQSYTTQAQHLDAAGKVVAVTRTHANGSLDYTQVVQGDGSSLVINYNAAGIKMLETQYHADHSKDVFTYNITGQSYATEHDSYDATGFLTTIMRTHADGSAAFKLVQSKDGTKTTDVYDAKGVLTSEVMQKADGYYSTTLYTAGVKSKAYVLNADHTQDNYSYNLAGQSYTTQVQHVDATGKVVAVTRTHANGSLDYTQVINSDGGSVVANYNAAGVKMLENQYHADHSKDVFTYNITGQAYTTEHDSYDASGFLTTIARSHADGSLAFKLVQSKDGTKTTDWYDAKGSLTNEVVQKADGFNSNTLYSAGVKTSAFITNADHTQDNYSYNIIGQSYTTQLQHLDAGGKVVAVTRTHANGSLDYTQVINSDGSSLVDNYNAAGVKTTEFQYHANGSRDVFTYNITGQAYTTEHDSYDTTGFLTTIVRSHSNGSLAFQLVQTKDGGKTTDWYDANGILTSEVVQNADGYTSTVLYTAGVKTSAFVTNPDHTQDNYSFNITGQTYTAQQQHLDASGKVLEVTRTHADGSLDYTQVNHSDGSSIVDNYNAAGVKTLETQYHADHSKDVFTYQIAGQLYTSEHDSYDATGFLTTIERSHADSSLAFHLAQTSAGAKTTDWYDSAGILTSEVTQKADGYYSTTLYSAGLKTSAFITNADHTQDNFRFNITGQSYTTQQQHLDTSGQVVAVTRSHADGTLDYTLLVNSDGSKVTDVYDSAGSKTQEIVNNASGTSDVFKFNMAGSPGAIQHESYDATGKLQVIDVLNGNGTHNVTAASAGVTIEGADGNDLFSSAPGSTTIKFDHGNDQINNFHAGDAANHDTIAIAQSLISGYSQLQFTQSGADTTVHLSASDSILLKGISVASLTSHDFIFV